MRKALCLAAGAAAILLAGAPAEARPSRPAAAPGRPTFYNPIGKVRRGLAYGGVCAAPARRCPAKSGNGRGFGGGLLAYGYGGLTEDPESLRDQGFFAGSGDSWAENGRAVYDYDRAYPYDWYHDRAAADPGPPVESRPVIRCEIAWVAGARGARAPVRVCRGRR